MTLTNKIIELVPEIVGASSSKCVCYVNMKSRAGKGGKPHHPCVKHDTEMARPITLADVLRAIHVGAPQSYFVDITGGWWNWRTMQEIPEPLRITWNLSTDLDGQGEETKAFLAKILGV